MLNVLRKNYKDFISYEGVRSDIFNSFFFEEVNLVLTTKELDVINLVLFSVINNISEEVDEAHPLFMKDGFFDILNNAYEKTNSAEIDIIDIKNL